MVIVATTEASRRPEEAVTSAQAAVVWCTGFSEKALVTLRRDFNALADHLAPMVARCRVPRDEPV